MHALVPQPVLDILQILEKNPFDGFIVGGSLRDLLLKREPRDWDITTNATPEQIQALFPDSVYENDFGTVGVKVPRFLQTTPESQETDIIEVTTYRTESQYTDHRHPDTVTFVRTIEEDLARRDFTVNAMAAKVSERKNDDGTTLLTIVDPFGGEEDLQKKKIKAVGDPEERFQEDALRILRAIRLLVELSPSKKNPELLEWTLEEKTLGAMKKFSGSITKLSTERIRDEFSRISLSPHPR